MFWGTRRADLRRLAALQVVAVRRVGVRGRRCVLAVTDALTWFVGLSVGAVLRFDFSIHLLHVAGLAATGAIAACAQLLVGAVTGLYRGRWRFASFEGVGALAGSCLIIAGGLLVLNLLDGRLVPESVPIIGGVATLTLMLSLRYAARLVFEKGRRPGGDGCSTLLIFGAGQAAEEVIATMLRNSDSPYLPIALLDDDMTKRRLSIMGVPVVGSRHDMARVAARFEVGTLLIAIRSGSGTLYRELASLASEAGLTVKVLPSLREVIEGTKKPYDIRRATIEDSLGRREIRTDLTAAAEYLTGRRVLVTGAGGSIGSELCRQIRQFGPAELIMLDRDETNLHGLQLSMEGHAMLDSPDLVLLDIRDRAGLEALFASRAPEVVFHAAALKHQPMLEMYPREAVKTNIWGTLNVLEAAVRHGVDRFVNISTDKAVDPSCVLGYSKRIAERLTATAGASCAYGTYLSVRFGNVLGSRGSVLHTFKAQIRAGGPVTVTDPEVRRYFMTVEEAIQLVIQAGAVGSSGEALVLDMGEPVRIVEVAQRMIAEAGERVDIEFTHLRRGEKLNEVLFNEDEIGCCLHHPLISHVEVPPLHPGRVPRLDAFAPHDVLVGKLRDVCRSNGQRTEDDPKDLEITTIEFEPNIEQHLLDGRLGNLSHSNGVSSPVYGNGQERCATHRRWADREMASVCPVCS